jgi:DNA mismatch repair protein MutS
MAKVTPVRKQYLRIKAQHPDAVVFFRLGDFYETFDEDAELAARELDLVLTSRPIAKGTRVPMAGVPYHAIDGYIARLIERGYRVAIAEQVGDTTARGLVAREVTQVVTPGTVVDPALLDEKRPSYLAALVLEAESQGKDRDGRVGLAFVDITTSEFLTTQLRVEEVSEEIARLQPREVLVAQDGVSMPRGLASGLHVTPLPSYRFELSVARQALLDHFGVATLAGFGCAGLPLAIRAAGAVVQYLEETQKGALSQIVSLGTYRTGRYMTMDGTTRRNLELTETIRDRSVTGSLLGVLDRTSTPMGGRLLRARLGQPLLQLGDIEACLDQVQCFCDDMVLRNRFRETLKGMPDLERLINRIVAGVATPRDVIAVRRALARVPDQLEIIGPHCPALAEDVAGLDPDAAAAVCSLVGDAIVEEAPASISGGGVIKPGFSAELDAVAAAARDAKAWMAQLERQERENTGIKSLKVGFNRVFGYYIEVTKSNLGAVPAEYIRKQTLVNAERFVTPDLKEYEALILNAEERQAEIEQRLFKDVCAQISARSGAVLRTGRALGRLDVAAALADVAVRHRYVRPSLTEDGVLHIVGGRHPVVERTLHDEPFVPNDLDLDAEQRILVITGPNMAGKSVYLRQAALIVLMAQMGSYVPADRALVGLVDRIFTRIGAQDEVSAGQSTFMVEMVETANILNHATPRSLLILDEIGRGTSTYDGLSIAWAVVEYLHNHPESQARTIFATHYHELTEIAERLPSVRNFNLAVVEHEGQVVFLHRVEPGGADHSYGIHVAQLAGVPRPVIHRAQELLQQLESGELRPGTPVSEPQQPVLFATEHPVVDTLCQLDISSLTPLEAINILYELQQTASNTEEHGPGSGQ